MKLTLSLLASFVVLLICCGDFVNATSGAIAGILQGLSGAKPDPWGLQIVDGDLSPPDGVTSQDLKEFVYGVTSKPEFKQRWAAVPWMKEVGFMHPVYFSQPGTSTLDPPIRSPSRRSAVSARGA